MWQQKCQLLIHQPLINKDFCKKITKNLVESQIMQKFNMVIYLEVI